jgi:hypothetical protein
MVDAIRELAAKLGNENVFKWAIRNNFYTEANFQGDLFQDIGKNGHLKVLELAHSNNLDWYSRKMLEDAVARTDLELLDFILNKKPNEFNLSFTRMCIAKGYIEVLEWWKQMKLVELFCDAAYSGQWRMMDSLYEMDGNKHPQF